MMQSCKNKQFNDFFEYFFTDLTTTLIVIVVLGLASLGVGALVFFTFWWYNRRNRNVDLVNDDEMEFDAEMDPLIHGFAHLNLGNAEDEEEDRDGDIELFELNPRVIFPGEQEAEEQEQQQQPRRRQACNFFNDDSEGVSIV